MLAASSDGLTASASISYTVERPPVPSTGSPAATTAPASLRLSVADLTVFGRRGAIGCRMASGPINTCRVTLRARKRVIARGARAAAAAGKRRLLVRLRLTAYGRELLKARVGGRRAVVRATGSASGATSTAAAQTRAILAVEQFTTPAGSWIPDRAALTPTGRQFLRRLGGKLIAISAARCDGYAAEAPKHGNGLLVSLNRARVMCRALQRLGARVTPTPIGHGSSDPIASNTNESGRAKNRRVKVTLHHRRQAL